ncbi:hypothetical protein FQN53_008066 [Emmonsiellopsis sp. PD_33]|nr:hypothetical protein FQN53_008066 [Emmonsiellopsis sp. PD_33]KAK2802484.1 hypothetical protein FQN51_004547 [Onygenales sp. PD_10]
MVSLTEATAIPLLVLVALQHPLVLAWLRQSLPWLWPQSEEVAALEQLRVEVHLVLVEIRRLRGDVQSSGQSANSAPANVQSGQSSGAPTDMPASHTSGA